MSQSEHLHKSCATQLGLGLLINAPPLFFFFLTSQGLFGKNPDSPAAADADASDTQSVDSGLSRQDSSTGKRDTVCQVSPAPDCHSSPSYLACIEFFDITES